MNFGFADSLPIYQMNFFNIASFSSFPQESFDFSVKVLHDFFRGKRDRARVNGVCREDGIDESELSSRIQQPCPLVVNFVLDLVYCPSPVWLPFFPFEYRDPKVIEGIPICIFFETKGSCNLYQHSGGAIPTVNFGFGWVYFSISCFEEGGLSEQLW